MSQKKFVVISGRSQDKRFGPQQLRALRSFNGGEELVVDALDRNAYQFRSRRAMGRFNGFAGRPVAEKPGHAPMSISAILGLQGADIGQFLQERWQSAQCAFLEIICGVEDHIFPAVQKLRSPESFTSGACSFRNMRVKGSMPLTRF